MQIWNPMPKLHKNQMRNNVFYFLMSTDLKSQGRRVAESQSRRALIYFATLRPYDLATLIFNFQFSIY